MPSVWSDNAPSRRSFLIPHGRELTPAIREHYGFDKINIATSFDTVEMQMELACRILTLLLQDVRDYDKRLASQDARDLVHLIRCLYRHLISAFMMEAERFKDRPSKQFKGTYDGLGQAIKIAESPSRDTDPDLDPTSRTLMELITRIIAQHCDTPLSLKTYESKLQNLRVSKWLSADREKRRIKNYIGIPVVIFVCIHTTDSNGNGADPQHVIGTSKEHWPGVPNLKSRDRDLRKERLKDTNVLKSRTENVWGKVEEHHKKLMRLEPKAGWTEESILKARKAAVAELQQATRDSEESSHRDKDQAAAFYFPPGKLGGRCFKCQCLYPFTMHSEANIHESTDKNIRNPFNKKFTGYPEGACAEDLVFPCCQAVNMSHRPQPSKVIGAKEDGKTVSMSHRPQPPKAIGTKGNGKKKKFAAFNPC